MSARALLPVAGFAIWASAFTSLYAMLSVGCAAGWEQTVLPGGVSLQRAQLIALALLHAALLIGLIFWLRRHRLAGFVEAISFWLAVLALTALLANFGWVLSLSPCT